MITTGEFPVLLVTAGAELSALRDAWYNPIDDKIVTRPVTKNPFAWYAGAADSSRKNKPKIVLAWTKGKIQSDRIPVEYFQIKKTYRMPAVKKNERISMDLTGPGINANPAGVNNNTWPARDKTPATMNIKYLDI